MVARHGRVEEGPESCSGEMNVHELCYIYLFYVIIIATWLAVSVVLVLD